jgi:hypothetical protein
VLLWAVSLVVLTFCMINVHEIGHTVAARLGGDRGASYALYERYPDGQFDCIGCNHFDPAQLTLWGKLVNAAAGVLATQIVFWLGILVIGLRRRATGLGVRLAWFVVFVGGDAVWQTLQALDAPIATQRSLTNVDFADLLFLVHRHWHVAAGALKVALAVVAAGYVAVAARSAFPEWWEAQRRPWHSLRPGGGRPPRSKAGVTRE